MVQVGWRTLTIKIKKNKSHRVLLKWVWNIPITVCYNGKYDKSKQLSAAGRCSLNQNPDVNKDYYLISIYITMWQLSATSHASNELCYAVMMLLYDSIELFPSSIRKTSHTSRTKGKPRSETRVNKARELFYHTRYTDVEMDLFVVFVETMSWWEVDAQ